MNSAGDGLVGGKLENNLELERFLNTYVWTGIQAIRANFSNIYCFPIESMTPRGASSSQVEYERAFAPFYEIFEQIF
jgi:hypothetical protein